MKDKKKLLDYEKRKYEKVWAADEYRRAQSAGSLLLKRIPAFDFIKAHDVKTLKRYLMPVAVQEKLLD